MDERVPRICAAVSWTYFAATWLVGVVVRKNEAARSPKISAPSGRRANLQTNFFHLAVRPLIISRDGGGMAAGSPLHDAQSTPHS